METRPDPACAHYYSTPNLGDEIQLRKAVIGFHSSDARMDIAASFIHFEPCDGFIFSPPT